MKSNQIPAKFSIPFANAAQPGLIRPIPVASQSGSNPGAASLMDGFPQETFVNTNAGGIPPDGRDFNGLFNQITAWSRWQGAGALSAYDAAFSSSIGGYPMGAVLSGAVAGNVWLCIVDDNQSNPDEGGAGWLAIATTDKIQPFATSAEVLAAAITDKVISPATIAPAVQSGIWNYAIASGTANALTVTLNPAPSILPYSLTVKFTATNTGSATIKVNSLSAVPIVRYGGAAQQPGDIVNGGVGHLVLNDAGQYQLLSIPVAFGGIKIFGAGTDTFVVPDGVTIIRRIRAWAGGGGGGGSYGLNSGGSGGGGSAYGELLNLPVSPGQIIPVSVGAGGLGGTGAPTNGTAGGSTSFSSHLTVQGGGMGYGAANAGSTTNAPAAPAPDANVKEAGNQGQYATNYGSGVMAGGVGGAAPFGGSISPTGVGGAGQAGIGPGGGGQGGSLGNPGGRGADGKLMVEW